jgi:integrase
LPGHSPAPHVRRPRLKYESPATGLDRNELGAILVSAGLGAAAEHALISLLALNGLRASEATGAEIQALGVERRHRTLTITRKDGKVVTIPLAPAVIQLNRHQCWPLRGDRVRPGSQDGGASGDAFGGAGRVVPGAEGAGPEFLPGSGRRRTRLEPGTLVVAAVKATNVSVELPQTR